MQYSILYIPDTPCNLTFIMIFLNFNDDRQKQQTWWFFWHQDFIDFKLQAVAHVKLANSKESTDRKFGVDSKRIREFYKQDEKLQSTAALSKQGSRKRLDALSEPGRHYSRLCCQQIHPAQNYRPREMAHHRRHECQSWWNKTSTFVVFKGKRSDKDLGIKLVVRLGIHWQRADEWESHAWMAEVGVGIHGLLTPFPGLGRLQMSHPRLHPAWRL